MLLITWWVLPFTLGLLLYSLILLITQESYYIYIAFLLIYIIDLISQIVVGFIHLRVQVWILLANAGLAIVSISLMIYIATVVKRIEITTGIFHLLSLLYTYYLGILFSCYSPASIRSKNKKKRQTYELTTHNENEQNDFELEHHNSTTSMVHGKQEKPCYMERMDYMDSMWSLTLTDDEHGKK